MPTFLDPDFEVPNLTNICLPADFDLITATIDCLDLSTDLVEEEDWPSITQSAIDSHTAQVIELLCPSNALYSRPCFSGPSSPMSSTRNRGAHTADPRPGRLHPS